MDTFSPSMTILLIDDDDKDRTYYAERIRIEIPECTVLEARDGWSGLALHRSLKIDCIITEAYLPDMSGLELLLEVVPRPSQAAIAVIFLTQTVSRPLNDLAVQLGAQGFFVKRLTSGEELAHIIPKAVAGVGRSEKRVSPIISTLS